MKTSNRVVGSENTEDSRIQRKSIFYGWWIVFTISIVLAIAWACSLWALPVFYSFWIDEFKWDRATVTGAGGVILLFTSACYPFAGAVIDRLGVKRVMLLCLVFLGASLAGFAFLTSLWQLYLFSALLGLGLAGTGLMTDQVLISKWFVKKRGLAVGITMAGIGIGASIGPQIAIFFISWLGWRNAFVAQDLIIWLVTIPLLALIVKEEPREIGLLPDGNLIDADTGEASKDKTQTPEEGIAFSEALKTSTLWLLSIASFLNYFVIFALINHLILYLKDAGYTLERASLALSIYGFLSFVGKIVFGRLLDVFHVKKNVMIGAYLLLGLGLFLLVSATKIPALLYVSVVFMGLAWGGSLVCMTNLTAYYFGVKYLGRVLGFVMLFFGMSGAVAPPLVGYIYDLTHSYDMAIALFFLLAFVSTLLLFLMPAPRSQTQQVAAADTA